MRTTCPYCSCKAHRYHACHRCSSGPKPAWLAQVIDLMADVLVAWVIGALVSTLWH
jgi:hypothetical protein